MIGFLRVGRQELAAFLFLGLFFVRGNVLLESFGPFGGFVFRMRLLALGLECNLCWFLFLLGPHQIRLGAFCGRLIV